MNNEEYREYVNTLAHAGLDMDMGPREAANVAIVDTENVGDEKALLFGGIHGMERLWPKDIITGTDQELTRQHPTPLRGLAVEILVSDLYEKMMDIENKTQLLSEVNP